MQMKYELFYLVAGSREADLETIKAGAREIVTAEGGVFDEKEVVEKRKLAYQVKHETHGFYVARRFELENTQSLQDITRKLNLNPNILRSIISRADELPELKTKEERINAASKQAERKPKEKVAEKAAAPQEKVAPKAEPAETKKAAEDIDKKLEEILNI